MTDDQAHAEACVLKYFENDVAKMEEIAREAELSCANDIRARGWAVAVHNDYRLNGEPHTFWLFTKEDRCIKGEGRTDAEALNQIRKAIGIE